MPAGFNSCQLIRPDDAGRDAKGKKKKKENKNEP
jgi:hypothetical protein